jgi:hypothetical protein
VALALERLSAARWLEPGGEVRLQVGAEHPAGTTLEAAHGNWTPAGLAKAETPAGLPRRGLEDTLPQAGQQVSLERVSALSGGMSSYYGFRGYYLSVVLWLERDGSAVVWDARGETAT